MTNSFCSICVGASWNSSRSGYGEAFADGFFRMPSA